MSALANLAQIDTSQIFADWGRPATLLELIQFYDPATGQLDESEITTDIVVIPMDTSIRRLTATSAQVAIDRQTILVREAELPSGIVLTSARIRISPRTLEIQAISDTSLQGVIALECVTDHRHGTP